MKHDDFKFIADVPRANFDLWNAEQSELVLYWEGNVVPKERPRTGKSGHVYTPKRTVDCEKGIAGLVPKDWTPLLCPVEVTVCIYQKAPAWVKQLPKDLMELVSPTKGDLDNKVKTITDGLNGIAYRDDAQIAKLLAVRKYSHADSATITVRRVGLSDHEARQIEKFL